MNYTKRKAALSNWLTKVNARNLWQESFPAQPTVKVEAFAPCGVISAWRINGHVLFIHEWGTDGFEIFAPVADDPRIEETFRAEERCTF